MRILVRGQSSWKCAPCVRAFADYHSLVAELQAHGATESGDVGTMKSKVDKLSGCVDEAKRQEAIDALDNLPETPDAGEILSAVSSLDLYDVPDQIAVRCCI